MKVLATDTDVDGFFRMLGSARAPVLALDYDGTLAPFTEDPSQAIAYPGVMPVLQRLIRHGTTRLIFITGRRIHDLLPLLELDPMPEIWGAHGYEHRGPGAAPIELALESNAQAFLDETTHILAAAAPRARIEHKPGSVAFHWRGKSSVEIAAIRQSLHEAWQDLPDHAGFRMTGFEGGLEFRAMQRNKGMALKDSLRSSDQAAFLGDDLTDEDAFGVLEQPHLPVLVRPELRPTCARLWIEPPQELLGFLELWERSLRPPRAGARIWK